MARRRLRRSDSTAPESQSAADVRRHWSRYSWAHKHWQQEALRRSVAIEVLNRRVHILHPEDLILMKLDAGGPQDLFDVKQILSAPPPQLNIDQLRASAARLLLGRALDKCMHEARKEKSKQPIGLPPTRKSADHRGATRISSRGK